MKRVMLVSILVLALVWEPFAVLAKNPPKDSKHTNGKVSVETKRQNYQSPDSKLRAIVIDIKKKGTWGTESRIEIRTARGELLFQVNYESSDGEHGYGVEKAAWTPNSQFFVWSMESSGGHSPWHHPTHFYSRKSNQAYLLDDFVGAITKPNFTLKAPDTIQTWRQQGENIEGVPITAELSKLQPGKSPKDNPSEHK